MIPWEHLRSARVPGRSSELRLCRHDRDYVFRIDGTELMNSRAHGSEEALAELALARIAHEPAPRVLVGGLGMGYTLARVLALASAGARVDVVELVPEVIQWNRELIGHLAGHPLRDRRATVRGGDVGPVIRTARAHYDAILLDVDNGPEGLTSAGNDRIYSRAGVSAARAALRPCGVLAIWSTAADPAFCKRMRMAGLQVEEVRVRTRRTKGPRRFIWLATPTGKRR